MKASLMLATFLLFGVLSAGVTTSAFGIHLSM